MWGFLRPQKKKCKPGTIRYNIFSAHKQFWKQKLKIIYGNYGDLILNRNF